MRSTRILAPAVVAVALAGCGSAAAHSQAGPSPSHTVCAAQNAVHRAVSAQCKHAQEVSDSVNAASTDADYIRGVSGWMARIKAAGHVSMMGVPVGGNAARDIAVHYAAADLALAVGALHDNPFAPHFSLRQVKRGYNQALTELQTVLDICALNGQ
jgi:hypothetical protein